MKAKRLQPKIGIAADGEGLVSHAGAYLVSELADRIGLTAALGEAMAPTRERRSAHDPGVVLRDLAVAISDGADCVSDLGALRGQEVLFGRIASETTVHRVLGSVDSQLLEAIRCARARARSCAWDRGARPTELTLDIDATLVTSHSDKEAATGNYKGGYGFHPLTCYLDETGEALAALLRPGNAGSNTAADHREVLERALEQLPKSDIDRDLVVRCDGAGATHAFTNDCRLAGVSFSVGYELHDGVRQAIVKEPESAWAAAIETDGETREGAWVAELTGKVDLSAWPEGTRLIIRRERPHPGAQFTVFDSNGYRHTAFLTDTQDHDHDISALELRHRRRARVEDRIRTGKDTGMRNLPHHGFVTNELWLELSLMAQDLFAWTRLLVLDGDLAEAEPKRLRQRLLHVAAKITRSGRRTKLRLPRSWPWAQALVRAFRRLRALPAFSSAFSSA